MKYVYLLQSLSPPEQRYVGLTGDIEKLLAAHNNGESSHTSKFRLWTLIAYVAFVGEDNATPFEKYLKSRSGRAFAKKRLWL